LRGGTKLSLNNNTCDTLDVIKRSSSPPTHCIHVADLIVQHSTGLCIQEYW